MAYIIANMAYITDVFLSLDQLDFLLYCTTKLDDITALFLDCKLFLFDVVVYFI